MRIMCSRTLIFLALEAYLKVPWVSSRLISAGEIVESMAVLALPPSEFDNKRVSIESRYGMWEPGINDNIEQTHVSDDHTLVCVL